ncbi:MAG: hypothetical protein ACXAC7_18590 [Candidatus Hodarchaeales archaeon]|jgi:hypothetical protein
MCKKGVFKIIENPIYHNLEQLNEQAKQLLYDDSHSEVIKYLTFLFKHDCELKEIIAKALMPPENDDDLVDEDKLNDLIIVQGIYNLFRIQLLQAITDFIGDHYDRACNTLAFDIEQSGVISTNARNIVRFYEVHLEKLKVIDDSYQGNMYLSMKELYNVVYVMGEDNLTRMTQSIINYENELVQSTINTYYNRISHVGS